MSFTGPALLSAKQSNLAAALLSKSNSLYLARGYTAITPTFQDDTVNIIPANGVTTPGYQSRIAWNLPKVSTLIGQCWADITLSAGTDSSVQNGGAGFLRNLPVVYGVAGPDGASNQPICELVKNVGDLIFEQRELIYGNVNLQTHPGRFVALNRRLCCNDVNIESTNAMVLGALPPGGDAERGTERVLVDAFYGGVSLRAPLEEMFFVQSRDRHWMPESLALEGQIVLRTADLGQLVCTRGRTIADVANPPHLSQLGLRYQEITLSAAEKEMRLSIYKSPEGLVNLFADLEPQVDNPTITGVTRGQTLKWNVQLNNFRMDMKELIFVVHRVRSTDASIAGEQGFVNLAGVGTYAGSYMESDNVAGSILHSPAENAANLQSYSSMVPITDFQLYANGKQIFSDFTSDFTNRTQMRKFYHRDSQIADPVYSISFAQFPEDAVNATGHLSAAVLGQLNLQINIADPGPSITYALEVWSHSYNLIQARAGGITKALN